jgi:hypothetical protein
MIDVVGNAAVARINEALRNTFDSLTNDYLSREPESRLVKRLRKYDHYQRLALGRAASTSVTGQAGIGDLEFKDLGDISGQDQDPCRFPDDMAISIRRTFDELLRYTINTLVPDPVDMAEGSIVSLFCNRTMVGPQEEYLGFFHRDLAPQGDDLPRNGSVGTMVWYPEVRDTLMEGAEFMAYEGHQDVQLQVLREQDPDYVVESSEYKHKAIALGYPHNYAHGVRPGRNPAQTSWQNGHAAVSSFIDPPADCFVKDMAIIVISNFRPMAT